MKFKFSYAECTIVSSARTTCPLCQATIQPKVKHTCSRTNAPARRRRARAKGRK